MIKKQAYIAPVIKIHAEELEGTLMTLSTTGNTIEAAAYEEWDEEL